MSFLKFFLLLSPYFFNVNTTFTSAKQYALSVHLMFELCLSQVFSSFEFKIARAKILLETFSELYANKGDFILELFFGFQGCCFGFYPSSMYFVVKHVNTRLPNLWRLFFKRSIYQASVIISDKRGTWLKQHFCSFWYRKKLPSRPMWISREDQDVFTVQHTQDYVQFILEAKKRGGGRRLKHPIEWTIRYMLNSVCVCYIC